MTPEPSEAELEQAGVFGEPGELDAEERSARERLATSLVREGVSLGELRSAATQRRLVLLPLERALRGGADRVTARSASERTGLSLDQLDELRATLGLTRLDPDEPVLAEADVEAFTQAAVAVAAGLPFDAVLEVNSALASGMPGLASTLRHLAATSLVTSDDEEQAALELARAASDLLPLLMPVPEYALRAHLEQQVVSDYVETRLDRREGSPQGVGFADLTGFTRLSESQPPDGVSALAGALTRAAQAVATGRVRLVKTIGDAVMLTAPTATELARAMLELLDVVAADSELPALRAAVAHGPVLQRAGDLFGRPVNLASRLTAHAADDTLVCDETSREELLSAAGLRVVARGRVTLKGIDGDQPLFQVSRGQTPPG